ncbi:MAG: hypothetical protein HZB56_19015 [Deltaproteobacteria bacterium]|nr:hypothetical protein [Deltaproteobacteria bacterium]
MRRDPPEPSEPYDREAAILALRARRAAARGLDPAAYPPLVTPACDRPTRPLPAARRRLYEGHLRSLLRALAAGERPPGPEVPPEVTVPPEVDQVLQAGCRACRGRCCETGGAHAYQTVDSLRRVRQARPDLSDDGVVSLYLAHLPARAVRDSCVFHGARGCTLPRDLRGDMCNAFFCEPLLTWRDGARAAGDGAAFVVGYDDGLLRGGRLFGPPRRARPGEGAGGGGGA